MVKWLVTWLEMYWPVRRAFEQRGKAFGSSWGSERDGKTWGEVIMPDNHLSQG